MLLFLLLLVSLAAASLSKARLQDARQACAERCKDQMRTPMRAACMRTCWLNTLTRPVEQRRQQQPTGQHASASARGLQHPTIRNIMQELPKGKRIVLSGASVTQYSLAGLLLIVLLACL